jgi:hypothetical protein
LASTGFDACGKDFDEDFVSRRDRTVNSLDCHDLRSAEAMNAHSLHDETPLMFGIYCCSKRKPHRNAIVPLQSARREQLG